MVLPGEALGGGIEYPMKLKPFHGLSPEFELGLGENIGKALPSSSDDFKVFGRIREAFSFAIIRRVKRRKV